MTSAAVVGGIQCRFVDIWRGLFEHRRAECQIALIIVSWVWDISLFPPFFSLFPPSFSLDFLPFP